MSEESKQLSKARQALVDRVLSRLDAGAMPWDNGMQGVNAMPFNAVSGARYRGMNALTLMLTFKQDPRWLTFNQAKDKGYTVKKGAKGVPIELYKTIDKRTGKAANMPAILEEIKNMTFTERQEFKRKNLQSFARGYYVFNASDVIGIEPYRAPELTPADVSARNERIERVIEDSQCPIRYDGNGRNYYSPSSDEIHLTERAAFKSDEFFYNTALHEMAHSTGHNSRLNRKGGTFGSQAYAREELVAEMASVLIAAELGLNHSDRGIENSAEYVRSWAKDIRKNPQMLVDAAFDASKATDYICDRERQRERTAQPQEKTQKESNTATLPAPPQEPYKFKTNLDNIPDAMKALPNWVAFRTEQVDGKIKKILLSPNKGASDVKYLKWAKSDDPTTWATFDKAVAFAKHYKLDGLAFAMSGSGMTCIDLDHHLDENGKPSELAQKFIDAAQGTYIEKSVSGRGLHIFYAGARPDGYQNRNIELDIETYDSVRFMSMTGNLYGNVPKEINPPSAELNSLLKSKLAKVQQYAAPSIPLGMDDNALIDKIRSSKVGYEFDALMRGENLCGDHSVSDFKLCNMLAFFSGGDAAQVERCFRSSGLYRPQKGDAYARRTAEKACSTLSKRYDPSAFSARSGKNTKNNGGKPSGSGGGGSSGR